MDCRSEPAKSTKVSLELRSIPPSALRLDRDDREAGTVDGRNPAPVEGQVVYPIIYRVFVNIPGGWEWDF